MTSGMSTPTALPLSYSPPSVINPAHASHPPSPLKPQSLQSAFLQAQQSGYLPDSPIERRKYRGPLSSFQSSSVNPTHKSRTSSPQGRLSKTPESSDVINPLQAFRPPSPVKQYSPQLASSQPQQSGYFSFSPLERRNSQESLSTPPSSPINLLHASRTPSPVKPYFQQIAPLFLNEDDRKEERDCTRPPKRFGRHRESFQQDEQEPLSPTSLPPERSLSNSRQKLRSPLTTSKSQENLTKKTTTQGNKILKSMTDEELQFYFRGYNE